VQLGANGPFTYVVKDDSTVEARPLTLGQENNGMTIVTHGLRPADRVVTSNQYRLQAGAHVQANSPAPRAT
jgi:multidrug efflux system membrane fusion protein